jgi:hypothetical protein
MNYYAYADNEPTDLVDPFGLSSKRKLPSRWRPCNTAEFAFCIGFCAKQGRKLVSCAVSQTKRIKSLKLGPRWYDNSGDPSCNCDDPDNSCEKLPPIDVKYMAPSLLEQFEKALWMFGGLE